MSGTGVGPQVFQQLFKPSDPSPQVMMGIDDFALRINDFFLHLIEPFSAAGIMIYHATLRFLHLIGAKLKEAANGQFIAIVHEIFG